MNVFVISSESNRETISLGASTDSKFDYLSFRKKEIDSFLLLGENWDGYGAFPLTENISAKAKSFLSILNSTYIDRISDIYPNPHGTISIEWQNVKKDKLYLEIGENTFSYFLDFQNNDPVLNKGIDVPNLESFISHLGDLFRNEPYAYFR